MKKTYTKALICIVLIAFSACSSSKLANSSFSRSKLTGTWVLSSVTYENLVENAVQTVFNQAPARDFQKSTWTLSNSGNGKYSLTNGMSQNIYWSFSNEGTGTPTFQFKKLDDNQKAKDVTAGYQLEVASADGYMLTLKAPVPYGGKTGYVVYNFSRK